MFKDTASPHLLQKYEKLLVLVHNMCKGRPYVYRRIQKSAPEVGCQRHCEVAIATVEFQQVMVTGVPAHILGPGQHLLTHPPVRLAEGPLRLSTSTELVLPQIPPFICIQTATSNAESQLSLYHHGVHDVHRMSPAYMSGFGCPQSVSQ